MGLDSQVFANRVADGIHVGANVAVIRFRLEDHNSLKVAIHKVKVTDGFVSQVPEYKVASSLESRI